MNQSTIEEPQPPRRDDEIDLAELFIILWKRKMMIAAVTMIATIAAVVVTLTLPKVYKITAIIEPGSYMGMDGNTSPVTVEDPQTIKANIVNGRYDAALARNIGVTPEELEQLTVAIFENSDIVKINVDSSNPERAVAISEELVELVQSDLHAKMEVQFEQIDNAIKGAQKSADYMHKELSLMAAQMPAVKSEITELEKQRKQLNAKTQNATLAMLNFSNEIQTRKNYLKDYQEKHIYYLEKKEGKLLEVEQLLNSRAAFQATQIIQKPTVSKTPVGPKKKLIVTLAFMVGFMGSIMLAFVIEFINNIRLRNNHS